MSEKKYKILYFDLQIPYLINNTPKPIGGAAVEWLTWLRAFKNIGCQSTLLTWHGAKSIDNSDEFEIVEAFDLNKKIIFQIPHIFSKIKSCNPDFIAQECANRYTGIFALISKLLGKPFIHRIASDMDVDHRIKRNLSKFYFTLYNYGIKRASHISCQNMYQYENLKKKYPHKSISILYNPFQIKEPLNKDISKEYIAWIGNFRFEKNLPALAEIAKALPQFAFKIAGAEFKKTDEDAERGLIQLNDLTNVEFVGHLNNNEITNFLGKSYCLLNTSRLEGFSNTFLEAWSVGVPVITTKNVNPDNIIIKYGLGKVVDNYNDLPNLIENFIETKEYDEYSTRCYNYISNKHNPNILAKEFLNDMINCKDDK